MRPLTFSLLGTSAFSPRREVPSSEIDAVLGQSQGWSERFSGVQRRFWVQDETLSAMGAAAARDALGQAGLTIDEVDLLIFAGAGFEQLLPCTAAFLLRELGGQGIAGFDINSTCLSFLSALEMAVSLVQTGRYRRILVVNAEIASGHLNPEHHESFTLFGDGATAYLLGRADDPKGRYRFDWVSGRHELYPDEIEACGVKGGGSLLSVFQYTAARASDYRFFMDGPRLFLRSDALVLPFLERVLGPLGLSLAEMDWVVPHQASGTALRLMRRRMGIAKDRWIDILRDNGNQVSVSIPHAFHHLLTTRRLAVGQRVLLCGTGAGLGLGAQLLRVEAVP